MIDSLIEFDVELFLYLNNLGNMQWDGFWMLMTNKFSAIPLYLLLLFLSYKQFGTKKTIVIVLFIAALIGISDQTSNLFKDGFKRLRPCHDESISHLIRLLKSTCGGLYAFFSAHAANSMAIAVFFGLLLKAKQKYVLPILILWAVLVAYSRIYIGVHFPLDVITGMFFGVLYGTIVYKLWKWFTLKFMN